MGYAKCLKRCSFRSTSIKDLKYDDMLSVLYYLLLQDRIEEALDVYSIINDDKTLYAKIQQKVPILFDYLKAYMALFVNDNNNDTSQGIDNAINIANEIASKYRGFPLIASKRKLFEDIEVLLSDLNDYKREDEDDKDAVIHGLGDRDRTMNKLADNTPSLDFVINESERKLVISYSNITKCRINFYTMNTEILFSNSPFFKGDNSSNKTKSAFAYIAPNKSMEVELEKDKEKMEFAISDSLGLKNQNVFIQVISDTLSAAKSFYDNELSILLKEQYGQLRVLAPSKKNKNKLLPIQKAYVKVYSQTNYGDNEFYKDGYTDIRGKFDYASISTDQLNKTKRFAIFVFAEGYGSIIKECGTPKR